MKDLIGIFKILSDETRLRIILLLSQEEFCVCQLSDILDETQPKISKSLARLRDLKLVRTERREKFIFYQLNKDNQMLNEIIDDVFKNIGIYPEIQSDQKRKKNAKLVLDRCGLKLKE